MTSYEITAATSVTVPALHPFYTYTCTIAAVTIGEGPYSEELTITMPEDGKHILCMIYSV